MNRVTASKNGEDDIYKIIQRKKRKEAKLLEKPSRLCAFALNLPEASYMMCSHRYHDTLIPSATFAFELRGMASLLIFPSRWSMPMKKL